MHAGVFRFRVVFIKSLRIGGGAKPPVEFNRHRHRRILVIILGDERGVTALYPPEVRREQVAPALPEIPLPRFAKFPLLRLGLARKARHGALDQPEQIRRAVMHAGEPLSLPEAGIQQCPRVRVGLPRRAGTEIRQRRIAIFERGAVRSTHQRHLVAVLPQALMPCEKSIGKRRRSGLKKAGIRPARRAVNNLARDLHRSAEVGSGEILVCLLFRVRCRKRREESLPRLRQRLALILRGR